MNIDFEKIKELFSSRKDIGKKKLIVTAYRDWKIMVVLFLISIIFIAVASFYLLVKINKEEIFLIETTGLVWVDRIKKDKLLEVVQIFEEKERYYEELSNKRPQIKDPSL